jgi:iron complex outermembrane receptor protein
MAAPALARAAEAPGASPAPTVSEVVVTADKAGLLERKPSTTAFGLAKPLVETPRSASLVSDLTIQRYGIRTINDFVAISPNTYTASFYGVPGSLNVRGTLADNYFEGFKLVENRGTYSTPIGDAAQIDIVRGPPSAIYGPGKVGGFLNFIPKSTASENVTRPSGQIEVTVGSYDKKNINGQFGSPFTLGTADGGVYAYAELEDSHSFYEGIHPRRQTGELSLRFDVPGGWRVSADALIYHSEGDVQTPGWNRLTPDLIKNGDYVTGRNTALSPSPGVPYLTPDQASYGAFGPYPFNFTAVGAGLYAVYTGAAPPGPPLPSFALDSAGAGGIARLSTRDVFVGPADFSNTFMPAVVLGVSKDMPGDATLRLQLFYNGLRNERFVSYGFPAWFRSDSYEARASYAFKLAGYGGALTADTIAGVAYRGFQGRDMQSYNSGVIALDRRDLVAGPSPTDTLCDPLKQGVRNDEVPNDCLGWETDIHSTQSNEGVFVTTDIGIVRRLDLLLSGRYDFYQVRSSNTGILPFEPAGPASASTGDGSFSASLSYKLGWGLMPYLTYARDAALEVQQAGDLNTTSIINGGWLSRSELSEAGLKFQLLNRTLVGAVDVYRQERTQIAGLNELTQATRSTGFEFEVRYLATHNLSFTLSGNTQHTEVIGPDHGIYYVPAYAVCANNRACELSSWGGTYLVFDFASSPLGHPGDYSLSTIPHSLVSLYGNYITDEHGWGKAGFTMGATYVSKTSGTIVGAVEYPAYTLVNTSLFYRKGPYEIDLALDNLLDTRYFTANSDAVYSSIAVIPGIGREWRLTLKRDF